MRRSCLVVDRRRVLAAGGEHTVHDRGGVLRRVPERLAADRVAQSDGNPGERGSQPALRSACRWLRHAALFYDGACQAVF